MDMYFTSAKSYKIEKNAPQKQSDLLIGNAHKYYNKENFGCADYSDI